MKKNLLILCDNYPVVPGEFFLDDELRIIGSRFEKILILVLNKGSNKTERFIPSNTIVYSYDLSISVSDKLRALPFVLKKFFRHEWLLAINKFHIKPSLRLFRIMYMDVVRSIKLTKKIKEVMKLENTHTFDTILYSYWHDFKALSLAFIKYETPSIICIARAHGWDVFFNRHAPPYLPFKTFIISHLDKSFSVSEAGKNALLEYVGYNYHHKIKVSRLGKINDSVPIEYPSSHQIIICSCSNIIPVKRIHLIIDVLSLLPFKNIKWVHFGDGPLRGQIEKYANDKLLHKVDYEIKGLVANSSILNFYHQNYVDLFINLSESEGIPVSIMEALSAGIPVLATNVGGVCEIVNDRVGFLIPQDFDMHNVIQRITTYLSLNMHDKRSYRINAYNFWKENFNANINYTNFVNDLFEIAV